MDLPPKLQNLAARVQPVAVHRVTFCPQFPGLAPAAKGLLAHAEQLGGRLDGQHLVLVVLGYTYAQSLENLDRGDKVVAFTGEQATGSPA